MLYQPRLRRGRSSGRSIHPRSLFGAAAIVVLGASLLLPQRAAAAQQQSGTPTIPGAPAGPALASRAELEALATSLERQADTTSSPDAKNATLDRVRLVRARLTDGDFRPGDRIYLTVSGPMPVVDTVSVRAGDSVTVKGITDVSLHGVLRAELEPTLNAAVAKLVRGETVKAGPLLWLAVLGGVTKPGFYAMAPDVLLGDALMRAGGPGGTTDLTRTVIQRNGTELYGRQYVNNALSQGVTLDQLALRSGDQIIVGEKKPKNMTAVLQAAAAILSLGFGIYGITRR